MGELGRFRFGGDSPESGRRDSSVVFDECAGDLSANHSPAAVFALPALVDYCFSLNLSAID
jgi:hypothetical protein